MLKETYMIDIMYVNPSQMKIKEKEQDLKIQESSKEEQHRHEMKFWFISTVGR